MSEEPQSFGDYTKRQVEAARRVLIDVGQILASFRDSIVVVGGWVPDLLLPNQHPAHVGSIDLDLALDAANLSDGRYAELLNLLLKTGRYRLSREAGKQFQLVTDVELGDELPPIRVDVEFLAAKELKLKGKGLIEGFRVLQIDACVVAFAEPQEIKVEGKTLSGARNSVDLRVASLPDFLILKSYALVGRDKSKDAYDICWCLDHYPGGLEALAAELNERLQGDNAAQTAKAISYLKDKFQTEDWYGPSQYADFLGEEEERDLNRQRAYGLVQSLLINLELGLVAMAAKLKLSFDELNAIRTRVGSATSEGLRLENQLKDHHGIGPEDKLGAGLHAAGLISLKQAEWLDQLKS